ncbi:hypothetical protein [Azospirillum soli]|uniref:hypothetical protein n=1 Tax=Azospirillum soli TaxID=1304799 RepID=UPI001AE38A9C|nr:hypothetical protein [Azospirillum soli]MBP2314593.1 hypothetical protein [Azospirillum soli]
MDRIARKRISDPVSARGKAGAGNATINRNFTNRVAILGAAMEWGACEPDPARDYPPAVLGRCRGGHDSATLAGSPAWSGSSRRPGVGGRRRPARPWGQVNFKAGTVNFLKTKTSCPTTITPEPATVEILSALARFLGSVVVFWHDEGTRHQNVAARFREIVQSAQESAHLHRFCLGCRPRKPPNQPGDILKRKEVAEGMGHSAMSLRNPHHPCLAQADGRRPTLAAHGGSRTGSPGAD